MDLQEAEADPGKAVPTRLRFTVSRKVGTKAMEALSPRLLLPRSIVCGGYKEELQGGQEGFVIKEDCLQLPVLG